MKKIVIFTGRYLPGYKDGGPIRSIVNLTDMLGDEYDFYIVCLDRDHKDTEPYSGIKKNCWNKVGKANVWYVSPNGFKKNLILERIKGMDIVYLTSFYRDYGYKALWLKKIGKIKQPVFLASMGVFSAGALSQKVIKKRSFIAFCKMIGLFDKITWSVTSEIEATDIKKIIGEKIKYIVAEDLPRSVVPGRIFQEYMPMRVVFLSRICPKKNLLRVIQELQKVKEPICFSIYGPVENNVYWNKCQLELKLLPQNVTWKYLGPIPADQVQNIFAENDVFFLPTLGENYGHVIFEAMSVGCIPVISDQTPWHDITRREAGFELPLTSDYANIIEKLTQIELRKKMAQKAVEFAKYTVDKNKKNSGYRKIFEQ